MHSLKKYLLVCILFVACATDAAENGVTDREVLLGATQGITGLLADATKDIQNGANAYFNMINAQGGVYGRKIRVVAEDDAYDPDKTRIGIKKLVDIDKVFALFNITGTANAAVAIEMLSSQYSGVPLIGPFSGSNQLRKQSFPNVFHVRATYADEISKIFQHFSTVGIKRIGIVWMNSGVGREGLEATQAARNQYPMNAIKELSVEANGTNATKVAESLHSFSPEAVVLVTTGSTTLSVVKAYNKISKGAKFYALSVMGSQTVVNALGPDGIGIVVASVVPLPWGAISPISREYQQAMSQSGFTNLSFPGLEAFINAKVIVEGLRRSGKDLTRAKFIEAMHSINAKDFGGIVIDFSRFNHTAPKYVELTIIRDGGKFGH